MIFRRNTFINLINFTYFSEVLFIEFNLISIRSLKFNFVIMIDLISILFLITVRIITLAVLKFRESYIKRDKNFIRFHLLLLLFVLRMYLLILRPNLVRLLLGWDGLGLSSYLLVIYYDSSKAYNSGIITVLTNRFGDTLILISIAYLLVYGNWNLIFYRVNSITYALGGLLITAACTKSAQIPFSAWLPAAIAAPTPVSSLVHSSTLVTAGVYILIRHIEVFSTNLISRFLIILGVRTIIMASLRALFETDLKKIVALSTLRQLGVMILRLGLGAFLARFFHLLRHAFFKALLFLTAGTIIHGRKDYQDLRLIGNSAFSLPVVNRFTLISRLRLIGAPFISAFFSKELVLETILVYNMNALVYYLIVLGVGLTALYRRRFLFLIFSRNAHSRLLAFKLDEDFEVIFRIVVLILPAIIGGFTLNYLIQTSLKLSSSPGLIKLTLVIILAIARYLAFYHGFLKLAYTWSFRKWILRSMWMLPIFRATLPININATQRILIPKIFDRGALGLQTILLNKYFNFSSLRFSSYTSVYKIMYVAVIWAVVVVHYYLRNIYNK